MVIQQAAAWCYCHSMSTPPRLNRDCHTIRRCRSRDYDLKKSGIVSVQEAVVLFTGIEFTLRRFLVLVLVLVQTLT